MKIVFHSQAWDDYLYWQEHDAKRLFRLNGLIKECMRTPIAVLENQNPCAVLYLVGGRGGSTATVVWSIVLRIIRFLSPNVGILIRL